MVTLEMFLTHIGNDKHLFDVAVIVKSKCCMFSQRQIQEKSLIQGCENE